MPLPVYAHFRHSTRKEYDGFFRPPVCAVGDRLLYAYHSRKMEIENLGSGSRIRPRGDYGHHRYDFPDGQRLEVEADHGRWLFDGEPVKERWPVPLRRELVCGERVFRVKPEDDTLFFAVTEDGPGWVIATMGLHIFLGAPGGGSD